MLRAWSCGLGATGEPPEGDEEALVVSALPVLRDSRVDVLLLCGVAREKAKGGEPVDDMLPPRAGWRNANG